MKITYIEWIRQDHGAKPHLYKQFSYLSMICELFTFSLVYSVVAANRSCDSSLTSVCPATQWSLLGRKKKITSYWVGKVL